MNNIGILLALGGGGVFGIPLARGTPGLTKVKSAPTGRVGIHEFFLIVFLIMAAVAAVFGAIIIGDFPYAGQHLLG